MLIKATPTGRQFGDKRPEETGIATIAGAKVEYHTADYWDGPLPDSDPDKRTPQYWRMTFIKQPKVNWP